MKKGGSMKLQTLLHKRGREEKQEQRKMQELYSDILFEKVRRITLLRWEIIATTDVVEKEAKRSLLKKLVKELDQIEGVKKSIR